MKVIQKVCVCVCIKHYNQRSIKLKFSFSGDMSLIYPRYLILYANKRNSLPCGYEMKFNGATPFIRNSSA